MFEKITDNVEIHQTLPDTPNLTTQELKIKWDKGCKIIKEAFNKLIDKLYEVGLSNLFIIFDSNPYILNYSSKDIDDILNLYKKKKINISDIVNYFNI